MNTLWCRIRQINGVSIVDCYPIDFQTHSGCLVFKINDTDHIDSRGYFLGRTYGAESSSVTSGFPCFNLISRISFSVSGLSQASLHELSSSIQSCSI